MFNFSLTKPEDVEKVLTHFQVINLELIGNQRGTVTLPTLETIHKTIRNFEIEQAFPLDQKL